MHDELAPVEVTIVVPTLDERASVGACLRSVQAQTEQRLQILVVDGGSCDGTIECVKEIAADDPRVELLHNPMQTVPYALNLALAAARAKWLVRVDAHATIPPGYVENAVQLLQAGAWGGVGGVKRAIGRTPAGRAVAAAMSSRFGVGGSTYHYGRARREVEHVPFGAYPVSLARELGGWGERFTVNQDFEFDHRLRMNGHRILFDPTLTIDWECRQTIRDLYRQYRRYGRGKVTVALTHPRSVKARHLGPPVLVLGMATSLVLAALSRPVRAPATSFIGLYGATLVLASARTAWSLGDWRSRAYVPHAFLAMHFGWGIGFLEGLSRVRLGGRSE